MKEKPTKNNNKYDKTIKIPPSTLTLLKNAEQLNIKLAQLKNPTIQIAQQLEKSFEPYKGLLQKNLNITPLAKYAEMVERIQKTIALPILQSLNKTLKSIPPERFLQFKLHSHNWIIADYSLLTKMTMLNLPDELALENFIITYYTDNDWQEADNLIQSWSCHDFMDKRTQVFSTTIKAARLAYDQETSETIHPP